MPNVQNMQNSLLMTERTSALWAVYVYFFSPIIGFSLTLSLNQNWNDVTLAKEDG